MNISEAARRSGLSSKTIRYYEDIGLIAPARRGDNGYRQYESHAVEELKFLFRAREVGFDLEESRQLLELHRDSGRQSRHARALTLPRNPELTAQVLRKNPGSCTDRPGLLCDQIMGMLGFHGLPRQSHESAVAQISGHLDPIGEEHAATVSRGAYAQV